jgi:multisite-specific tRNA:(cytosine-C5)-methyltransferase
MSWKQGRGGAASKGGAGNAAKSGGWRANAGKQADAPQPSNPDSEQATGSEQKGYVMLEPARSAKFDAYYKAQKIVATDEEFEQLVASLLSPLPVTFRINPLDPMAISALKHLTDDLQKAAHDGKLVLEDGTAIPPPRQLPWYPRGLAWHVTLGRRELRRAPQGGQVKALHNWINTLNNAGVISRQEAVSMVPPLLLEVEPHHAVSPPT